LVEKSGIFRFFSCFFFSYFCGMMKCSQQIILSRIAPTPSGYLHAGNAFSFVLTWLLLRKMGGKLLLRIDDSDAARSRPEYIEDIFNTLDWLGIDWDLGPEGPDDFARKYSQKHRFELYRELLDELRKASGQVYACRCSRKQIQAQSRDGLYPGSCSSKALPLDLKNTAWRIRVPENEVIVIHDLLKKEPVLLPLGIQMGDFVIRRKDGLPAYQLVSLADDMHYGVNLIVRGGDLYESTAAQLYLSRHLANASFPWTEKAKTFQQVTFCHHGLILDQDGEKLSKSRGAASILQMREAGIGPEEIYRRVAAYLGIEQTMKGTLEDLLVHFNLENFLKAGGGEISYS
jgi:glutamyl/glutaminyl-tRNA synthetase